MAPNLPPYAKSPWTESDLQRFVQNNTGEDQHLEFKAIEAITAPKDADRTEMSRDVSSIANADGGTIIYGIIEHNKAANRIAGARSGDVDCDALNQVLNSRIQPPVENMIITEVTLSGVNVGTSAFVIDVPKATTRAPHQAHDRVYYRRYGTEKLKLDHSGVIDLLGRADAPELEVWVEECPPRSQPMPREHQHRAFSWTAMLVKNVSRAVCLYAIFDIFIDSRLDLADVPSAWDRHDDVRIAEFHFQGNRHKAAFHSFQRKWNGTAPDMVPIFEGSLFFLSGEVLRLGFDADNAWVPHFIAWRCRAPGMAERRGRIAVWLDGGRLSITPFEWE